MRRREFIGLLVAGGASLALAACGGAAGPPTSSNAASVSANVSAGASSAGANPAGSRPKLTAAYASVNGAQWPHWLAAQTHAWSDHGVDVDLRYLEGDVATKALVARQIDVLLQSAPAMITANLNGALD